MNCKIFNLFKILIFLLVFIPQLSNANDNISDAEIELALTDYKKTPNDIDYHLAKLESYSVQANNLSNNKLKLKLYKTLSDIYISNLKYNKNLEISTKGLTVANQIKSKNELIWFNISIADSLFYSKETEQYGKMEKHIKDAINYSKEFNNNDALIYALLTYSKIKNSQGLHRAALDLTEKAKKKISTETKTAMIVKVLDNTATLYRKLKNYKKAIISYKELIEFAKKTNDQEIYKGYLSIAYFQITKMYTYINNKKESLFYAEKHHTLAKKLNNKTHIAYAMQSMGMALIENKRFSEAEKTFIKANAFFKKDKNNFEIDFNNNHLAIIYFNLNNYEKSINILKKIIEKYNTPKTKNKLIDTYHLLSNIYKEKKEYKLALNYSKKHYQLYEEEFNKKFKNTINELKILFDTTTKERKNKELLTVTLKQKNKIMKQEKIVENQTKWIFIITIVFSVFLTLIIILVKIYRKVKFMANTDELTKLSNRRTIMKIANKKFKNNNFCITIFDIDRFKLINDTYGHHSGDIVLRIISKKVKENLRNTEYVGRFGGEEFIIVSTSTKEDTYNMAERLRKIIENIDYSSIDKQLKVTSSFGISDKTNCKTVSLVINKADENLYRAKESGRNKVCI